MLCVMFEHGVIYVRYTYLQRVTDVTKTSVQGHMLGGGFICQIRHGGIYGELTGTWRQMMECYVEAQDARS